MIIYYHVVVVLVWLNMVVKQQTNSQKIKKVTPRKTQKGKTNN